MQILSDQSFETNHFDTCREKTGPIPILNYLGELAAARLVEPRREVAGAQLQGRGEQPR